MDFLDEVKRNVDKTKKREKMDEMEMKELAKKRAKTIKYYMRRNQWKRAASVEEEKKIEPIDILP